MAETVEELGADGSSPAHVEPPGPSPTQLNSTWLVVWWCFGSVWMLLDTYNVLPAGLGWLFFQVVWWLMVQVLVYVAWPWMLAPGLLIDGPVRILLALLPNLTGYMLPLVPRFVQELILRGLVVHLALPPVCTWILNTKLVQKRLKDVEIVEGLTCSARTNPLRGYFGFDLKLNGIALQKAMLAAGGIGLNCWDWREVTIEGLNVYLCPLVPFWRFGITLAELKMSGGVHDWNEDLDGDHLGYGPEWRQELKLPRWPLQIVLKDLDVSIHPLSLGMVQAQLDHEQMKKMPLIGERLEAWLHVLPKAVTIALGLEIHVVDPAHSDGDRGYSRVTLVLEELKIGKGIPGGLIMRAPGPSCPAPRLVDFELEVSLKDLVCQHQAELRLRDPDDGAASFFMHASPYWDRLGDKVLNQDDPGLVLWIDDAPGSGPPRPNLEIATNAEKVTIAMHTGKLNVRTNMPALYLLEKGANPTGHAMPPKFGNRLDLKIWKLFKDVANAKAPSATAKKAEIWARLMAEKSDFERVIRSVDYPHHAPIPYCAHCWRVVKQAVMVDPPARSGGDEGGAEPFACAGCGKPSTAMYTMPNDLPDLMVVLSQLTANTDEPDMTATELLVLFRSVKNRVMDEFHDVAEEMDGSQRVKAQDVLDHIRGPTSLRYIIDRSPEHNVVQCGWSWAEDICNYGGGFKRKGCWDPIVECVIAHETITADDTLDYETLYDEIFLRGIGRYGAVDELSSSFTVTVVAEIGGVPGSLQGALGGSRLKEEEAFFQFEGLTANTTVRELKELIRLRLCGDSDISVEEKQSYHDCMVLLAYGGRELREPDAALKVYGDGFYAAGPVEVTLCPSVEAFACNEHGRISKDSVVSYIRKTAVPVELDLTIALPRLHLSAAYSARFDQNRAELVVDLGIASIKLDPDHIDQSCAAHVHDDGENPEQSLLSDIQINVEKFEVHIHKDLAMIMSELDHDDDGGLTISEFFSQLDVTEVNGTRLRYSPGEFASKSPEDLIEPEAMKHWLAQPGNEAICKKLHTSHIIRELKLTLTHKSVLLSERMLCRIVESLDESLVGLLDDDPLHPHAHDSHELRAFFTRLPLSQDIFDIPPIHVGLSMEDLSTIQKLLDIIGSDSAQIGSKSGAADFPADFKGCASLMAFEYDEFKHAACGKQLPLSAHDTAKLILTESALHFSGERLIDVRPSRATVINPEHMRNLATKACLGHSVLEGIEPGKQDGINLIFSIRQVGRPMLVLTTGLHLSTHRKAFGAQRTRGTLAIMCDYNNSVAAAWEPFIEYWNADFNMHNLDQLPKHLTISAEELSPVFARHQSGNSIPVQKMKNLFVEDEDIQSALGDFSPTGHADPIFDRLESDGDGNVTFDMLERFVELLSSVNANGIQKRILKLQNRPDQTPQCTDISEVSSTECLQVNVSSPIVCLFLHLKNVLAKKVVKHSSGFKIKNSTGKDVKYTFKEQENVLGASSTLSHLQVRPINAKIMSSSTQDGVYSSYHMLLEVQGKEYRVDDIRKVQSSRPRALVDGKPCPEVICTVKQGDDGSKMIQLTTGILIRNHTDIAVRLRFESSLNNFADPPMTLSPLGELFAPPCPATSMSERRFEVRPDGFNLDSCKLPLQPPLLSALGDDAILDTQANAQLAHLKSTLMCGSAADGKLFHCHLSWSDLVTDELGTLTYTVTLLPFLELVNELPYAVKLNVRFQHDQTLSESKIVLPGGRLPVKCCLPWDDIVCVSAGIAAVDTLSAADEAHVRSVFRQMDADASGLASLKEISKAARTSANFCQLLADVFRDNGRPKDPTEFVVEAHKLCAQYEIDEVDEEKFVELFRFADKTRTDNSWEHEDIAPGSMATNEIDVYDSRFLNHDINYSDKGHAVREYHSRNSTILAQGMLAKKPSTVCGSRGGQTRHRVVKRQQHKLGNELKKAWLAAYDTYVQAPLYVGVQRQQPNYRPAASNTSATAARVCNQGDISLSYDFDEKRQHVVLHIYASHWIVNETWLWLQVHRDAGDDKKEAMGLRDQNVQLIPPSATAASPNSSAKQTISTTDYTMVGMRDGKAEVHLRLQDEWPGEADLSMAVDISTIIGATADNSVHLTHKKLVDVLVKQVKVVVEPAPAPFLRTKIIRLVPEWTLLNNSSHSLALGTTARYSVLEDYPKAKLYKTKMPELHAVSVDKGGTEVSFLQRQPDESWKIATCPIRHHEVMILKDMDRQDLGRYVVKELATPTHLTGEPAKGPDLAQLSEGDVVDALEFKETSKGIHAKVVIIDDSDKFKSGWVFKSVLKGFNAHAAEKKKIGMHQFGKKEKFIHLDIGESSPLMCRQGLDFFQKPREDKHGNSFRVAAMRNRGTEWIRTDYSAVMELSHTGAKETLFKINFEDNDSKYVVARITGPGMVVVEDADQAPYLITNATPHDLKFLVPQSENPDWMPLMRGETVAIWDVSTGIEKLGNRQDVVKPYVDVLPLDAATEEAKSLSKRFSSSPPKPLVCDGFQRLRGGHHCDDEVNAHRIEFHSFKNHQALVVDGVNYEAATKIMKGSAHIHIGRPTHSDVAVAMPRIGVMDLRFCGLSLSFLNQVREPPKDGRTRYITQEWGRLSIEDVSVTTRHQGLLRVSVVKASDLAKMNTIGHEDPYCMLTVNGQMRRTEMLRDGGLNPKWIEDDVASDLDPTADSNYRQRFAATLDDCLEVVIKTAAEEEVDSDDRNLDGDKVMGMCKIPLGQLLLNPQRCKGILHIKICEGRGMPVMDKLVQSADPYVIVQVENMPGKTKIVTKSLNPKWDEGSGQRPFQFKVHDRQSLVSVHAMDYDKMSNDDMIGHNIHGLNGAMDLDVEAMIEECLSNGRENVWADVGKFEGSKFNVAETWLELGLEPKGGDKAKPKGGSMMCCVAGKRPAAAAGKAAAKKRVRSKGGRGEVRIEFSWEENPNKDARVSTSSIRKWTDGVEAFRLTKPNGWEDCGLVYLMIGYEPSPKCLPVTTVADVGSIVLRNQMKHRQAVEPVVDMGKGLSLMSSACEANDDGIKIEDSASVMGVEFKLSEFGLALDSSFITATFHFIARLLPELDIQPTSAASIAQASAGLAALRQHESDVAVKAAAPAMKQFCEQSESFHVHALKIKVETNIMAWVKRLSASAGDWDPQVFEVLKYLQVGDLASADGSGGGIRFLIKRIAEVRMPHLHLEPMRFPFGESVTTNQAIQSDATLLLEHQSGKVTRALLASILVHSTQIPMMRLERDYLNVYREREHGPAGRLLDVVRGRGAAQEPLNGVAVLISSKRPMPLLLQRLCKQSVIPIVFDDDWWTFDDARSVVEYWNKTMAQQKAGVSHIHTVVIVSHGPVGGFQLVKDSKMDVRHAFEDYYHDVGKDAKRKDVMEAEEQYKWWQQFSKVLGDGVSNIVLLNCEGAHTESGSAALEEVAKAVSEAPHELELHVKVHIADGYDKHAAMCLDQSLYYLWGGGKRSLLDGLDSDGSGLLMSGKLQKGVGKQAGVPKVWHERICQLRKVPGGGLLLEWGKQHSGNKKSPEHSGGSGGKTLEALPSMITLDAAASIREQWIIVDLFGLSAGEWRNSSLVGQQRQEDDGEADDGEGIVTHLDTASLTIGLRGSAGDQQKGNDMKDRYVWFKFEDEEDRNVWLRALKSNVETTNDRKFETEE